MLLTRTLFLCQSMLFAGTWFCAGVCCLLVLGFCAGVCCLLVLGSCAGVCCLLLLGSSVGVFAFFASSSSYKMKWIDFSSSVEKYILYYKIFFNMCLK